MEAAILLSNPKFPRNLAEIVRLCSAYSVSNLRYTGERMDRAIEDLSRLPREERMKGYKDVTWKRNEKPFNEFKHLTPVAIEVRDNSEMLQKFEHPENALYVFGPEDGSLSHVPLSFCHRFVAIPTAHCLNLSTAVATVLYDRMSKMEPEKRMNMSLTENRGFNRAS